VFQKNRNGSEGFDLADNRSAWFFLALAAVFAAIMVGADWLSLGPDEKLTREDGAIETVSMVLYAYAALCWLILNPRALWSRYWHLPAVLLLMAGRELDLDVAFTSPGILTTALYFTDRAPVWQRLLGAAVVALLVTIAWRLISLHGRAFIFGLKSGRLAAWCVAGAVGLAVGSILIDGLGRKLRPLGIELSPTVDSMAGAGEEIMEAFIPILLIAAIIAAARSRNRQAHP
jgi:hypothetical protein